MLESCRAGDNHFSATVKDSGHVGLVSGIVEFVSLLEDGRE